jgi:hypothetical protein
MRTKCTATTGRGDPCRAWATHDTNPPVCAAHARRAAGAGGPDGDQEHPTAGFYSRAIADEEIADLVALAGSDDLTDEIGAVRVALRRVLRALGEDPDLITPELAAMVFVGARTVARLLRDRRAIAGGAAKGMIAGMEQIIAELGEELGGRFIA